MSATITAKSPRLQEADEYSKTHNLDHWGTRVAWLVLTEGVVETQKYCNRHNTKSRPWAVWTRLVDSGVVVPGAKGGIVYESEPKWEGDAGTMRWFHRLVAVGAGQEISFK